MRKHQRTIWGSFFALGLIVPYFTGSAIVNANSEAKLQIIPESIIVSPVLLKQPPKFKGAGFTPKELVLVDIIIPKGMEVLGLEKGQDKVGLAFTYASDQGDFEVTMDSMRDIHPLRIELDREEDGRWLASVPALPGVMAYGATDQEAIRKAKAVALQILADMIESGEEVPESLKVLFAA